jgi:lipopolysaccharide biosynthesis glycosyltransferase
MKLRSDFAHLPVHEVGRGEAPSGDPIVLACTERYGFPAQVTLASLLVNSPSRDFEVVLLANGWEESDSLASFDQLGKRFGSRLTIVRVDETLLPEAFAGQYIARTSFFRLMLADMIDCDRLVHLNPDVIVQAEIAAIWEDYREEGLVGGVPDATARDWQRRRGGGAPDLCLNTGVLLINCDAWREQGATRLCEEWLSGHRAEAVLGDQDAINNALIHQTYAISEHWNVTRNELRRRQVVDIRQLYDADGFKGIFQFDGPSPKPWCRWADPFSQELYLRYARIVGLPPDHWVEARTPREALMEARWAERQGNLSKANEIYRKLVEASLPQPNEQRPDAEIEVNRPRPPAGLAE